MNSIEMYDADVFDRGVTSCFGYSSDCVRLDGRQKAFRQPLLLSCVSILDRCDAKRIVMPKMTVRLLEVGER